MFRKISGKENKAYTQALKDIVDLSKTTIRSTAVPFKQQIASNVTVAASKLADATNIPRILATSVATTPAIDSTLDTTINFTAEFNPTQAQNEINQNLDEVAAQATTQLPTQRVSDEFVGLMEFLKSRIPYGVNVTVDMNLDAPAAADSDGNIIINPSMMMDVMSKLDPLAQRGLLDAIINEELGHVASFNSLTQTEIDELVDSFTDDDFADIANAYYANNPSRIPEVMANLQSDKPSVVARQKEVLVQEKLRMRMQEVTRGYTTEDDNAFWSSKPSLLAILKRYIGGVLNRFINTRKMRGSSNALDAAAFSLIQEMEAISVGFTRTAVMQPLDTDAPAAAIEAYNRILNRDIFGEINEQAEAQTFASVLATSALSIDTFTSLMQSAGLALSDGNQFIDVEPTTSMAEIEYNKANKIISGWRVKTEGIITQLSKKLTTKKLPDSQNLSAAFPISLSSLKDTLGYTTLADYKEEGLEILDGLPQAKTRIDGFIASLDKTNKPRVFDVPNLVLSYSEDYQSFTMANADSLNLKYHYS
jgi:hypothetical protein